MSEREAGIDRISDMTAVLGGARAADMIGIGLDGKKIERSKLRRMVGRWSVSL